MTHTDIQVSASILSANFKNLEQDIKKIEIAGADSLHLDIMDNRFVPNISFGPPLIKPIRQITSLPLDAHLMIDAPWLFFDDYINLNISAICFHIEAYDHEIPPHSDIKEHSRVANSVNYQQLENDIYYLKTHDINVGITINPNTETSVLYPILNQVDSVLVMSVHPGFSGQSFIPNTVERIQDIRNHFDKDIKVDGGVNNTNAKAIIDAGANILISASYLFSSKDYKEAIQSIRRPV